MKIYILHGWTYSKDKWNPFLSLLESKGLNPYLLSIPGLTDKIDEPWDINEYVKWLFGKIGKEEKIILIGHSNGGRIAMNFAIKHPNKVSGLILIDSAGIYHNEITIRLKRRVFGTIAKVGRKILKNDFGKNLLYFLSGEGDYKNANENMKKTMVSLLSSDKVLKPGNISTPTILIWGEKDRITPLSDGKLLESKIANSKLLIVNGARHAPQFTHPEEVANLIINNLTI